MVIIAALFLGCADDPSTTPSDSPSTPTVDPTPAICDDPPTSSCGKPGSVIVGEVRLPEGHTGPTDGDLIVYLNHASVFGNADRGGFLHYATRLPDVDLADGPVEFELDMCDGGAMWSEHNCGYVVIGILDRNGNNDFDTTTFASNPVPDAGELAFRHELELRCDDTGGHCIEAVLDCEGPSCAINMDEGACSCEPTTCTSVAVGCQ